MPWLEALVLSPLLGELQTSDPTSVELAAVGIVSFLAYEILARPAYARRRDAAPKRVPAKPQADGMTVPARRRVA